MVTIPMRLIQDSYGRADRLTIWNGIAVFGGDRSSENQVIDLLKTLSTELQLNLAATTDHEGTIFFFWKSESRPHLTESYDIVSACGGYFGENYFIS